ncbi:Scn11a [Symbiodinium pilosum]|uniref:Scn11a protein n=1 Tax=Symbiodinium pilosum TaxID=2952 RepID=A0A812QK44_SYMPI|nr:Scn11a [Symbiodinium pilosum]
MPKPAPWPGASNSADLSKLLEAEQHRILDLARAQHDAFEQSVQLSFSKILQLEAVRSAGQMASKVEKEASPVQTDTAIGPTFDNSVLEAPRAEEAGSQDNAWTAEPALPSPHSAHSAHSLGRSGSSLKKQKTKSNAEELLGLSQLVSHTKEYIDFVAGALVLLNSCIMLAELEAEGLAWGAKLGLGTGPSLTDVVPIFQTLDTAFVFVFSLELFFRVVLERWDFVRDVANWFDAFLVAFGIIDILLFVQMSGSEAQNLVLLRLVRVLKSIRAIRMLRTFRFLKGLRFLVKACYCFLPSLGWSMLLLLVFICMGTLVLGNLLQDFIADDAASLEDRQWVWDRYGTASRAMYTFYEITFAGNWPTNARPVMDKVHRFFVLFFVLYVTTIVFAALRVITAVFLRDTLDAARNDDESLIVERLRNKTKYLEKLGDVFEAIDADHNGIITEDQLIEILEIPKAVAYFQTLDVDVLEGAALFRILDNGDGRITHEEFIDGILRCKGKDSMFLLVAKQSKCNSSAHDVFFIHDCDK